MTVSMCRYLGHLSLLLIVLISITGRFAFAGDPNVASCSTSDIEALLEFKNGLIDPNNWLSSWNGSNCCQWEGIGCNNVTGDVIAIDLHSPFPVSFDSLSRYGSWNLSGEISPSLTKLKFLEYLDLSLNVFDGIAIPEFLGSLKSLRYLNLSKAGFAGLIPASLGNLSSLEYLDLSCEFGILSVGDLEWVSGLGHLKILLMNDVDLSLVGLGWLEVLGKLRTLSEMYLSGCQLSGSVSSPNYVNFSSLVVLDLSFNSFNSRFPDWLVNITRLVYIDLSNSNLYGEIPLGLAELPNLRFLNLALNDNLSANCPQLFERSWKKIEVLHLDSNKLRGKLPESIGNMTSLTRLHLFSNSIEGTIPSSIGRLCNLEYLDISGNNLTGNLPRLLEGTETCVSNIPLPNLRYMSLSNNFLTGDLPEWLGQLRSLSELSLSYNLLQGSIPPSLGTLHNLTTIRLGGNELNGTLPNSFGQLSKLSTLDVSSNQLTGMLSEVHFSKLSNLTFLQLSWNSFYINIRSDWIPPFQLGNLGMGSCHVGPSFPSWLQFQTEVKFLDLSNASISGPIPHWFWNMSSELSLLNVSHNQLTGQLPNLFHVAPFADIDLSYNLFEGFFPLPSVEIELLDLSNNNFSGPIPHNIGESLPNLIFLSLSHNRLTGDIPVNIGDMMLLQVLDLSRNRLSGNIPSSIGNCSYLKALDLENNNLSGTIPGALGQLGQLRSLHLNENMLSGNIPSSFRNLSALETLDLGNNNLEGNIPPWIGVGLRELRILRLRSNGFSGTLSSKLSNLSSLQVLDLAENKFTGNIPSSFGDFKAISQVQNRNQYLLYGKYRGLYYEENLVVSTKSQQQKYTKTLSLMTSLDLSGNNLSGEFPQQLTKLLGLVVLNLSRNHFTGHIPQSISRLSQLSSLDLSSNMFSGAIPTRMSTLTYLGHLNLSNNNLSGRIPFKGQLTTFDANSFTGNPGLCGQPLPVKCQDEYGKEAEDDDDGENVDAKWFYFSLAVGFVAGIWVPFLLLVLIRSWRYSYINFLDSIVKCLLAKNN